MASESGGEEILYPRKVANPDVFHQPSFSPPGARVPANHTTPSRRNAESPAVGSSPSTAGSYAQFGTPITAKQRRPRTSDAETDSSGVFSPKPASSTPKDRLKEDASASARKHRSLGLGMGGTSLTPREKGARESSALGGSSVGRSSSTKHSRSSSSSSQAKRGHVADYSHLPPSPSSTSHHPAVKHAPTGSTSSPLHVTSAVAHSLLRGTQEGWSAMDDEATTEALRKLDGVSGKSPHARARTSIGSRPNSISRPSSRPGTPGAVRGAQWEGIAAFEGGGRSSRSSKKASSGDERRTSTSSKLAPAVNLDDEFSSEGQNSSEKPSAAKKRSSIIASKRGSTPSTSYTGTTTASSRDSGSMSVGTSLTSVSANSHRHSLKAQRNSAGSDISAHSSEVASLRDRAAALVSTHDVFESEHVPPVPPLPKDLSNFRSPPHSTTSVHFPTIPMPSEEEADADRTVSMDAALDAPSSPAAHALSPVSPPPAKIQESSAPAHVEAQPAPKTPSKKWSFNLKLSSSSAASRDSTSKAINSPISSSAPSNAMSPRLAAKRSMDAWSQPEAMGSAASLGSLSSVGSVQGSPAASLAPSFTITSSPDHVQAPSNPAGRTSTDQASGGLAPSQTPLSPSSSLRRGTSTRRLTPSSIPFFRRSSSQAAQPQSENEQSTSPSVASPMKKTSARLRVKSTISPTDASLSSPATPGSTQKKSSVLSLGFLRGSSSRKSLQSDREQADVKAERESRRLTKEAEKLAEKDRKKDEKDRSESRISVLMGRKRGKVHDFLVLRHTSDETDASLRRLFPLPTRRRQKPRLRCLPCKLVPCRQQRFNEWPTSIPLSPLPCLPCPAVRRLRE
jgi:dual specificity tyrosine-phosphorylation-regulated kinase 2/3/4